MFIRRHFQQKYSLEQRLAEEAERLRKDASDSQPGVERERLIRKAQQAETAAHMFDWLRSHRPLAPRAVFPRG
jgi:hypothetical protein